MDVILFIIGIVFIVVGKKKKDPDGKISKEGKTLLRMGIVAVIISLIPFTIGSIYGLRGIRFSAP